MIGSGELKSIQELVVATIELIESSGVSWVSAGSRGLTTIDGVPLDNDSFWWRDPSENRLDMRERTLEWKRGVVIGNVSISYC